MTPVLKIVKARVALETEIAPIPKLIPYPKPGYGEVNWSNVTKSYPHANTRELETALDSYFTDMIELGQSKNIVAPSKHTAGIRSLDTAEEIIDFLDRYDNGQFNLYAVHLRHSLIHSRIFFAKPNFERELFNSDEWKTKFERIIAAYS